MALISKELNRLAQRFIYRSIRFIFNRSNRPFNRPLLRRLIASKELSVTVRTLWIPWAPKGIPRHGDDGMCIPTAFSERQHTVVRLCIQPRYFDVFLFLRLLTFQNRESKGSRAASSIGTSVDSPKDLHVSSIYAQCLVHPFSHAFRWEAQYSTPTWLLESLRKQRICRLFIRLPYGSNTAQSLAKLRGFPQLWSLDVLLFHDQYLALAELNRLISHAASLRSISVHRCDRGGPIDDLGKSHALSLFLFAMALRLVLLSSCLDMALLLAPSLLRHVALSL